MKRSTKVTLSVLSSLIAGCLLLWIIAATFSRETVVPMGKEAQYDDFGFTVLGCRAVPEINGVKPSGEFIIIKIQVANHAKRVDFTFDPDVVFVGRGKNRFGVSDAGQIALGKPKTLRTLGAGESADVELVFDVPKTGASRILGLSYGGSLGEAVDAIVMGLNRMELRPER